jgi:septal ring factor EnvC (AmiA/AmiB activator)
MKLVFQTSWVAGKCRLCADIDRKRRRIFDEEERIRRWEGELAAWEMSIANSERTTAQLQKKIQDLTRQRKTKLSR